ncbi:MAG: hypothetical protein R3C12_25320 [Planctomycetaceae bacterium]
MSANYRQELEVALQAVSEAARVCRSVQSKIAPNSMEKADRSPVTIADYASQAIVARLLSQAFPHDPIIGEEDAGELRLPEQAAFRQAIHEELRGRALLQTTSNYSPGLIIAPQNLLRSFLDPRSH